MITASVVAYNVNGWCGQEVAPWGLQMRIWQADEGLGKAFPGGEAWRRRVEAATKAFDSVANVIPSWVKADSQPRRDPRRLGRARVQSRGGKARCTPAKEVIRDQT